MKKWIIKNKILCAVLSTCIIILVVAVGIYQPWRNKAVPASAQNQNTAQEDKGNQENPSNRSDNSGQPGANGELSDQGNSSGIDDLNSGEQLGAAGEAKKTSQTGADGGANNTDSPEKAIQLSSQTFTIKFETNGGLPIADIQLSGGTKLDNLSDPYKADSIFMGWYYDAALADRLSKQDIIKSDITLYAKYSNTAALEETETPRFATKLDQPVDFSFVIISSVDASADQVKTALTAINITNSKETDFFQVNGSNGRFTVSAKGGKFDAGNTYKFTLSDENLTYEGFGQTVRDYNFTTAKDEVLNLSLNSKEKYIQTEDVSEFTMDGQGVSSISIPLETTDLGTVDYKSGTFKYEKSALAVGDNIAIYSGTRPDLRKINDDSAEGDVAYVTITAVNGTTYNYKNADAKDVLFTPDVLPVNDASDLDGDKNNHSITVEKATMDFSSDTYSKMGLSDQTAIDVGDFIAFYSGELGAPSGNASYGRITSVRTEGDDYVIAYDDITADDITAAMDVYDTKGVSGETLLKDVDQTKLEENIEQQARDSGFANKAAQYLAALTLETDSFKKLDGDFDLDSYDIHLDDGTQLTKDQVQLMDGKKVSVELSELKATISTKLVHFQPLSGVRCTLKVGIQIKISTGDDSEIVIGITGYFEQEARVSINTSGGAVWKWWGIFPYISEYQLNANIDLFEYTGISIQANIATKEKKEEWKWDENSVGQSIAKELKGLLDARDKYVGDGSDTVTGSLADKYKAMLGNESDWVELFSKDIFSQSGSVDPFHILAYEVDLKFVVTANMNISLGCDFSYENAKRYNYSIGVFKKTCTNNTIDLVEEHYQFDFYVMGTMGLRAGIKFEVKVGLFSTKLDSVGISAEAGAYIRVWGYFYYELSYTASNGKESKSAGALLFELGVYLEIKFEAQAFGGTFSYNPTLYDNEWPIWSAGSRENVQAFADTGGDVPNVSLKKHLQTFVAPDDYFKMSYLDLKTGDVDSKDYDDEKCFKIEMTNKAFSYDPKTNIVKVAPDGNQVEKGQMVITWINAPLAFTSKPIQKTIDLYWDNYNDGYAIVFNSNGGSATPTIMKSYNAALTAPANPTKTGYDFSGWYSDAALTKSYTVPATMPNSDSEVFAKWSPRSDTKYIVEHYQQNLNNNLFTLVDTDNLQGTTDSKVKPLTKTYEGFSTPSQQELTILPDGSAVMKYYYSRNSYTLTFMQNIDNGESDWVYNQKYGSAITTPQLSAAGYSFTGWNSAISSTMPATNLVYKAQWVAKMDTPYLVEHYVQNINNDDYTLSTAEYRAGETNAELHLDALLMTGDGITYKNGTVKGQQTKTTPIAKDGKLVIKQYYSRNNYTVATHVENGTSGTLQYRYKAIIGEPEIPVKAGYTFSGWYKDEQLTTPMEFGNVPMPASNVNIYGKLSPKTDTTYRVEHYVEQTNGSFLLRNTDNLTGTTDSSVTVADLINEDALVSGGITYKEGKVGDTVATTATITGDGQLVIKLYYQRVSHTLTFKLNNGSEDVVSTVKYGQAINTPTSLTKKGYNFNNWDSTPTTTMPNTDVTYTAQWVARDDTAYVVKHIRQALDDSYLDSGALVETESKSGTTDTDTAAVARTYDGFTSSTVTQSKIKADGSTVIEIQYTRNSYPVTWKTDESIYSTDNLKYGQTISVPKANPTKTGYVFYAWDGYGDGAVMPANAVTYSAKWIAANDTAYTVKHLREDLNGNYTIVETEMKHGTTNANTAAEAKTYDGNTSGTVTQKAIDADGTTEVEIRYSRNTYTVTWMSDSKTFRTESVKYGYAINVPMINPDKIGYDFKGWGIIDTTMPAKNVTYNAIWQGKKYIVTFANNDGTDDGSQVDQIYGNNYVLPGLNPIRSGYAMNGWFTAILGGIQVDENTIMNTDSNHTLYAQWVVGTNTKYTVKHYQQNINDDGYTLVSTDTQTLTGVTDANSNATAKNYIGFTPQSFAQLKINGDGSTIVQIYYTRNSYSLTFMPENGSSNIESTLRSGMDIVVPASPDKNGYTFGGWGTVASTMPANDVSYQAIWTANTYSVTFNENGGDVLDESRKDVTYDSTYGTLPAPIRAGYTFDGWYTELNGSNKIESDTKITVAGSQTVYAHWTANTYKVSFDPNGGNVLVDDSKIITYDSTYGTLPKPSRTGYSFDGWYTAVNGGNKILETDNAKIITAQTLYAHWTANQYIVVFNGNSATSGSMANQVLTYNTNANVNANNFARTGYRFAGWATSQNGEVVYTDSANILNLTAKNLETVTLYAKWTIKEYSISFDSNGGSTVNTIAGLHYADVITEPSQPNRQGYNFEGWYTDSSLEKKYTFTTMPENSLNLYAKWTVTNYNISYELNGGTNHTDNLAEYTIETPNITLGNPTRSNYTFDGWYTDDGFNNKVNGVAITSGSTGSKTFYAKWTAVVYTISYGNLGGTQNTNPATYTVENSFTFIAPSNRLGYTFGGWYDNASFNGSAVTTIIAGSSGDKNLYAKWVAVSYDISYVLNEGTNNSGNISSYNIESASITLAEPTRSGYSFAGWYTDSNFANKVNGAAISCGSTGKKTFYAKWVVDNYTIQYQLNGGTNNTNPSGYTIESSTITLSDPIRAGYTFDGWYDNSTFSGPSITNILSCSVGNRTLYAKWKLNTYTITYNLYDGTNGANPSAYTVESDTIALQNPTKGEDDVFTGWYTNSSFTGTAVTHITNGSTGNVTLYAKWLNYGRFTVTNNGDSTFTITRTGGTDGAQTVYYETQNGSAISGTQFDSANSNVTFAQGESTKTVSIIEHSVTTQYGSSIATSYSNADRVYFLDLYKVDGGGKLGSGIRATRTMAKSSDYVVDSSIYAMQNKYAMGEWKVDDSGLEKVVTTTVMSNPPLLQNYINSTASSYNYSFSADVREEDDGYQGIVINLGTELSSNVSVGSKLGGSLGNALYAVEFEHDTSGYNTNWTVFNFPYNQSDDTTINNGQKGRLVSQFIGNSKTLSVPTTITDITLSADASGTGYDNWYLRNICHKLTLVDTKEPTLMGVAPMASKTFAKGDIVVVSLVFDEIVNSADGVSINTMLSESPFTLAGGVGTNVLYFEGAVTNNGFGAPTINDVTINNNSNVKDMCNN